MSQVILSKRIKGELYEVVENTGVQIVCCNGEFMFSIEDGWDPITFTDDVIYHVSSILVKDRLSGKVDKLIIKSTK